VSTCIFFGHVCKIARSDCYFMSDRSSVRMELLGFHLTDFHEVWYVSIFGKSTEKILLLLLLLLSLPPPPPPTTTTATTTNTTTTTTTYYYYYYCTRAFFCIDYKCWHDGRSSMDFPTPHICVLKSRFLYVHKNHVINFATYTLHAGWFRQGAAVEYKIRQ
jgi:hypothetical protein